MEETWTYHLQLDENGRKHRLHAPSCEANLTFIPGSTCASLLNEVALCPCEQPEIDRALVRANAGPAVVEPLYVLPAGKRAAAGAVVMEPDGRIWLVAPSNGFGGYQATFPKGRVEPGVSLQATAIKEVWEESGLLVALKAYLGDFSRTQTYTRFYLARRVGGHPAAMGWESQAVHLATPARARQLLNRETDHAVLDAVIALGL
jgi:8-oxo-dGTP pyrophosphatase MutT (NUDIX family)